MRNTYLVGALGLVMTLSFARATDLDLRGGQATPVAAFGAYWATVFDQTAGSGAWDPFFDLQNPNGNNHTEKGYNTDGMLLMDQQRTTFNKDLPSAGLTPLNVAGIPVPVFGFWLDSNETGGGSANRTLAVDTIRIYSSTVASISVNSLANLEAIVGSPLYNMDSGGDNRVLIDSTIGDSSGSGSSDLIMYVPVSYFDAKPFIYLYNENGISDPNGPLGAHAGYEEWRAFTGEGRQLPDGGMTVALLGLGIVGICAVRRRGA